MSCQVVSPYLFPFVSKLRVRHRELYPREKGTFVESENARLKPERPKSLEAKRASQSQRKSPMVVLKKGKGHTAQYKSQDIISDSGSEGEDEKEDA